MAGKKKAADAATEVTGEVITGAKVEKTDLQLVTTPAKLIEMIDKGQSTLVPTEQLNTFYVQADALGKRLENLKKLSRDSIIARRDEGKPSGEKNQHRFFSYPTPHGEAQLTVQEKRSGKLDPIKLEALLVEKKLWDTACNLVITTSGDQFQKFLRKHKRDLVDMGVVIEEQLDMGKVDGLCQAKLITVEEVESMMLNDDPTYALLPKLK